MEYKQLATVEQVSMHFSMDGNLMHVESDEARRQQTRNNIRGKKPVVVDAGTESSTDTPADGEAGESTEGDDGEGSICKYHSHLFR